MILERRSVVKKLLASAVGIVGMGFIAKAVEKPAPDHAITAAGIKYEQDVPLFSSFVTHNGLVYIAGIGAHFEGDIKAHTEHVLNEVEKLLIKAGSSMDKVLKVSVFLHDLNDYKAMNEAYKGRFGKKPPVRTTVAVGGVPGESLVEIDCIAVL